MVKGNIALTINAALKPKRKKLKSRTRTIAESTLLVNVLNIKDLPIQVIDGYGVIRLQDIASVSKQPFTPIEDIALSKVKDQFLCKLKHLLGKG